MLVRNVLVICVGNICRSPVGEHLLRQMVPALAVGSAGLGAMVGHAADAMAAEVAAANGVSLDGHVARQFTPDLGSANDLLLAMEPGHKREVARLAPHLSGRTLLFDQWTGMQGIADPYRRSRDFHEGVFQQIKAASEAWAARLKR
ncbi:MAG: low molecular weight phosphotyrosine protein phosphatase [Pseudorhodobacter sp.]|nr:low molecular weight phosphotyrosine protein phosphatase [Pseudorhodobacter sp.]